MSESDREPVLLSSLEALQHNLQDAGMLRMKASLYSEAAVREALAAKWKKIGLTVEQVSVQDVRYGDEIVKKYNEAQAAEIDRQKALNEQEVAKTEAETKKIKAQGEADANAVLNESLTDNVLKQHYIDALSNADQLVVVPDGADTLVQTK